MAQTNEQLIDIFAARTAAEIPALGLTLLEIEGRTDLESGVQWFENLQHAVFRDDHGVRYYGANRDGRCLAVMPVRLAQRGPLRVVEALANFYTSLYAPPLVPECSAADLAQLLARASTDHGNAHEMRFAPMDPNSEAFKRLSSALAVNGWAVFHFYCFGNWHLKLDCPWDTYLRGRPGQLRSTIKRMRKKFSAAGGSLEIVCTGEHLEKSIADYCLLYTSPSPRD